MLLAGDFSTPVTLVPRVTCARNNLNIKLVRTEHFTGVEKFQ